MSEIFKVTLWVKDIKDTTTTVKSDIETKQKDHEQVRTITATNTLREGYMKLVLTGPPELLEGFTLDAIDLRINADQTQLQTGEDEEEDE